MSSELLQQIIALPRGVQPDGSPTLATREVALTAVHYYEYHGAHIMLLPGGRSFMADDLENGFSDGEAMRQIVLEKGVPKEIVPKLVPSSDTITNALTCVPWLDKSEGVAVVAKQDQTPRGVWAVRLALASENVMRFVAMGDVDENAIKQERKALLISRALFAGVRAGDVEAIEKRNVWVQGILSKRKASVKSKLASASHYQ